MGLLKKKSSKGIKSPGVGVLRFVEPKTIEDAIDIVSSIACFLNLWMGRTEDWRLAQILSVVCNRDLWGVISKHVEVEASGIRVSDLDMDTLKMRGVVDAICAFGKGIEEQEVHDIYRKHCVGINEKETLAFMNELSFLKSEISKMSSPENILSYVITRAIGKAMD